MKTRPVLGQTKVKRQFLFLPQYLRSPKGEWGWQWLRMRTVQYEYRNHAMMIIDGPAGLHPIVKCWRPIAWLA